MFSDNGVPGVSLGRVIGGTHRMDGANTIIALTDASRITLRVNVRAHTRRDMCCAYAFSPVARRGRLVSFYGCLQSVASASVHQRRDRNRRCSPFREIPAGL